MGSSPEKKILFYRWVWKQPNRPKNFPSHGEYPELIAQRKRQVAAENLIIAQEFEQRRLQLEHIANDLLDEQEIRLILLLQEPEPLLALASNPQIEAHWIQRLINCHHVKGARAIRESVVKNLDSRQ